MLDSISQKWVYDSVPGVDASKVGSWAYCDLTNLKKIFKIGGFISLHWSVKDIIILHLTLLLWSHVTDLRFIQSDCVCFVLHCLSNSYICFGNLVCACASTFCHFHTVQIIYYFKKIFFQFISYPLNSKSHLMSPQNI